MCWVNGLFVPKKLDQYLIPYIKINFRLIKDLNIKGNIVILFDDDEEEDDDKDWHVIP